MEKRFDYIKGEEGSKFIYKILRKNKPLYINRLKDKRKIESRGTDLYLQGKCQEGFKYISALRKIQGSEIDLEFDYKGRFFLLSLRDKAIIREK